MALIISLNLKLYYNNMNLDFSDDQKFFKMKPRKFFDKEGGLAMLESYG